MDSGALLGKILNTTSTCIFWKDAKRRFVGVNQAFLDYYGFSSKDMLIGRTDEDMGWHSNPDPFQDDEWKVLNEGISTSRVHGRCVARGEERDILASKSPIYENGKIIGLVGTFEDVTDEYRKNNEIQKLTETLDAIPCGICIVRPSFGNNVCVSVNQIFADMVGAGINDFVGHNASEAPDYIYPGDLERWRADVAELYAGRQAMDGIYRFRKKSGEYIWLRMRGIKKRLKDDEEFVYYTITDESDLKKTEKRENSLKKLYASSVEAAKLVVWEYDPASDTMTFGSEGYTAKRCRELGIPSVIRNVPGSLYDLIPPQYHEMMRRIHSDVMAGKQYTSAEVMFRPEKSQAPLYLRISYITVTDDLGHPVMAYGASQNLTREKAADLQYEHELEELNSFRQKDLIAKGRHNLTMNSVTDYHIGLKDALDVTGMKYDEAFERLKAKMRYKEDRSLYESIFSRKNLIANFYKGETFFSMEYRREGKPLAISWVRMEVRTFQNSRTDDIECFIYSYDVTAKYIREQLTDNLSHIGYEYVGFINCDDRSARLYGISEDTHDWKAISQGVDYDVRLKKYMNKYLPGPEQDAVITAGRYDMVISSLEKTEHYNIPYDYKTADGSERRKQLQFNYTDNERSVIFFSIQDITEQYLEEQKQIAALKEAVDRADEANAAKRDFLSRISHDIRTPLNGIIGMAYLAGQQENTPAMKNYLSKIDTSSKFLLGLVNDVLDMSKIESNKIVLHPEPYPIEDSMGFISSVIRPLCEGKHQQLVMDIEPDVEYVPMIDILRMNQILFNLFSNAVKYTPENGSITFRLRNRMQGSERMLLEADIIDNGIGMSEELQKVIFEPFTQGERSDTSANRGSGLGLSIVKNLIELMGGSVSVKSEPDKGSDFHISVGFSCIPAETVTHKAAGSSKGEAVLLTGRHVLLCEDHPLNQEITVEMLQSRGMIVSIAENGQIGVDKFVASGTGYYDIILMDIRMPVMDGYEATRQIRALDRNDAHTVPIIAMTADAFEEDVKKCGDAGMNGHISKPVEAEKLFEVIADAVGEEKE